MSQVIRGLALMGAIWTICVALLAWLVTKGNPGLPALALLASLLLVFARLYLLKRWALVATCGYCWWMAVGSFSGGIWQWSLGWLLLALLLTMLCVLSWATLEPGF